MMEEDGRDLITYLMGDEDKYLSTEVGLLK